MMAAGGYPFSFAESAKSAMPDEAAANIAIRAGLLIARFFIDVVFEDLCGWIGHHFVRLVTFGKIHLSPHSGGESTLASVAGAAVLLGGAILLSIALG